MNQKDLSRWIEDEEDKDEREIIKLDVGESIEGILMDKFDFQDNFGNINWGYIIKTNKTDEPKLLFGTTVLNRKMLNRQIGEAILIERLQDQKSKKGKPTQIYKTYHK